MSVVADKYTYEYQLDMRRAAVEADRMAAIVREQCRIGNLAELALGRFKEALDSSPFKTDISVDVSEISMESAVHCDFAERVIELGYPLQIQGKTNKQFVLLADPTDVLDLDHTGVYRIQFKLV